jgi:purine nucleoside phosphorylase
MQKLFMARRNWCRMKRDGQTGAVAFNIWVEKETGLERLLGVSSYGLLQSGERSWFFLLLTGGLCAYRRG